MFSYQGSCHSFLATALIFYQIHFALSRTFLFSFLPFRFPLGRLQATACIGYHICKALSTVFFHLFSSASGSFSSALLPPAVPPPRLRLAWFPAAFQGPVISDRCYLITRKRNCQCFFCFLFISDNSYNFSFFIVKTAIIAIPLSSPETFFGSVLLCRNIQWNKQ